MGMIRKAASVCTLGMVKYTSRREAQTKEALASAKYQRALADSLSRHPATGQYEVQPRENVYHGPVTGLPWYQQPTLAAAILALRANQK